MNPRPLTILPLTVVCAHRTSSIRTAACATQALLLWSTRFRPRPSAIFGTGKHSRTPFIINCYAASKPCCIERHWYPVHVALTLARIVHVSRRHIPKALRIA